MCLVFVLNPLGEAELACEQVQWLGRPGEATGNVQRAGKTVIACHCGFGAGDSHAFQGFVCGNEQAVTS